MTARLPAVKGGGKDAPEEHSVKVFARGIACSWEDNVQAISLGGTARKGMRWHVTAGVDVVCVGASATRSAA